MTKRARSHERGEIARAFGDVICRLRCAAGHGQDCFADMAGLHRTHISLIERGQRLPTMFSVYQIASALGMTMTALIHELEKELRYARQG